MYDPYEARRARRAQRRYYRSMRRGYRSSAGGLAGGLFIIALIIGFSLNDLWAGHGFLVLLFVGLGLAAFFGSASSGNAHGIYGGIQGAIWMFGLALCFIIGFWPWILLPVAASMILGALINPITSGIAGAGFMAMPQQQPYQQQPYQQPEQPGYEPYQQGYQAAPAQPYQEANQQPKDQYEQPQVQYPEQQQELPPMEMH